MPKCSLEGWIKASCQSVLSHATRLMGAVTPKACFWDW